MNPQRVTRDYANELEERVAGLLSGRVQPGSGSGKWAKMDARGSGIIVSCKSTKHRSFSVTKEMWEEVERAARGPGGTGDVPAMAVEVDALGDPEVFLLIRPSDFADLMASDETIDMSKQSARKKRVGIPRAMRGER